MPTPPPDFDRRRGSIIEAGPAAVNRPQSNVGEWPAGRVVLPTDRGEAAGLSGKAEARGDSADSGLRADVVSVAFVVWPG